jgi:hypothetical protein
MKPIRRSYLARRAAGVLASLVTLLASMTIGPPLSRRREVGRLRRRTCRHRRLASSSTRRCRTQPG